MVESSIKGLLTELYCETAFTQYGIVLSQPITQNSKYDFIADINHKLIKIQCKTASVGALEDFITIDCYTTNIRNGQTNHYSENDVDYFYTYYDGVSYLIPFYVGGQKTKTLRFKTNQNFINPNIKWAKDYTLEKILSETFNLELIVPKTTIINSQTNESLKKNFCIDCGKPISSTAMRCIECGHKMQMVVERPKREDLKQMIRNESFVSIAKKYNVSDKAICKWCKKYNLPSKKKEIKTYSDEEWSLI